ncbi:HAMP domain-containing sensor histidine kinase [Actinomadura miaoliensis]|uniref:histidine kinase n=1 Tax=Actinomadura miaoliensis TaxID=430685 RepID=A0ABP7X7E2_9ACTN
MRRRLLLTYLALIGGLVLALAVPLAWAYAQQRTGVLLLDRRADATRLAELTDQAVREGDTSVLVSEVRRYASLYGAGVEVRDDSRAVLIRSGTVDPPAAVAVRRALAGRTTERLPLVTPFGPDRVVVAEPAGRDAQVVGMVLVEAPTIDARRDIALVWLTLAAAAAAAFTVAVVAARRLTRWTLRPVAELDAATEAIAAGRMHARAAVGGPGPSELRRLEERFNAMADAVSAALERQRAFVADASHELRTPLAVLSLRLENLQPHLRDTGADEHRQALEEVDRLGAMLEDLLTLARLESGTGAAAGPVDLVAELAPRLDAWGEVAAARTVDLHADLPERLTAHCPPDTAGRVADIAIDNAIKFVPDGGHVTVSLSACDGTAVLRVADDGPGLDPDELEAARRRFWRSPRHGNVEGSGLGLAIADELARAGGGTLALRPADPHGLVVELRLPLDAFGQP